MKVKVAITGGIGSGKSLAAQYISEIGYPVFSCDQIYKEIIKSEEYIHLISRNFPACVTDNQIDRRALADIVFKDKTKLEILNRLAHPLIMNELRSRMESCSAKLVFAEVPLLFECGYENEFDFIIIIMRNLKARITDIARRDGISEDDIIARINNQFHYSEENISKHSTKAYILYNNDNEDRLEQEIKKCLATLEKRFS